MKYEDRLEDFYMGIDPCYDYPTSICWHCARCTDEEPGWRAQCAYYGFSQKPRKKKCKGYKKWEWTEDLV